jgi:hypothetical protein
MDKTAKAVRDLIRLAMRLEKTTPDNVWKREISKVGSPPVFFLTFCTDGDKGPSHVPPGFALLIDTRVCQDWQKRSTQASQSVSPRKAKKEYQVRKIGWSQGWSHHANRL